ncbi:hypothetical protein ACFGT5_003729 [Serratia marcescens]|nr:hypothetical protein [Serratia marcescens]
MMDKLSELSKPEMYVVRTLDGSVASVKSHSYTAPKGFTSEPLYSQEYVSALDKVAQFWIGESAGWKKRAEDAEKRIAELEEEFSFIMGQNDGMEKELRDKDARIEHLEAKLATPVRLPDIRSDDYHETGWFQHMKYYRDVERSILAAGFAVGDE